MQDENTYDENVQRRADLVSREDAIVRALFSGSRETKVPVGVIKIPRLQVPAADGEGTEALSFRVRGIKREVLDECTKLASRRERDRDLPGYQFREVTNQAELESLIIHRATVREDRALLWDNPAALNHYGVGEGPEVIREMLLAGEIASAVMTVFELSGFGVNVGDTRDTLRD